MKTRLLFSQNLGTNSEQRQCRREEKQSKTRAKLKNQSMLQDAIS